MKWRNTQTYNNIIMCHGVPRDIMQLHFFHCEMVLYKTGKTLIASSQPQNNKLDYSFMHANPR